MSEHFPHLFSPHKLRHLTLKNRINFGTHSANMAVEGRLGERGLNYYLERARGGAAMICVEPLPAHPVAVNTRGQFNLDDQDATRRFRRLTDAVHAFDTVIMQQIFHIGAHADSENSHLPAWAPSAIQSDKHNAAAHAMTGAEVEETLAAFVNCAWRIRECGFDGVEINAGYDSLIPSFWAAHTNRRVDGWGGDFEARMRFSVELLRRVRDRVGDDFIIGLTMTGDDRSPGGMGLEARQAIARYHDDLGLMDYVAIKTGSYMDWTRVMPTFMFEGMEGAEAAARIKQVLKHAKVQAESRIRTPANAEAILSSGGADMVSFVRAQIADPYLARKALEGRPLEVRGCISCNQVCWGRRVRDTWISCLVNPSAGREFEWGSEQPTQALRRKHIVVVGAGPAGLEVARVAAERGHRVTLIDRNDRIGGQFRLAATQPSRGEIAQLLNWYFAGQIFRLGIDLRLETAATAESLIALAPDEIVLATGSEPAMTGRQRALPSMRRLPGVEAPSVFSVDDVLLGREGIGERVLVLDDLEGWLPAAGTVAYLAKRGHAVTVAIPGSVPMRALAASTADGPIRQLWADFGVQVLTDVCLVDWSTSQATFRDLRDGHESSRPFDSLVLATLNRPTDELASRLSNLPIPIHQVGDCVAPRTAAMAFKEGRDLGLRL